MLPTTALLSGHEDHFEDVYEISAINFLADHLLSVLSLGMSQAHSNIKGCNINLMGFVFNSWSIIANIELNYSHCYKIQIGV